MSLIQGGIDKALELLGSAPTVAAQKAHLDWLREQLTEAEKKLKALEEENTQLRAELENHKANDPYLDMVSCLFKRGSDGEYSDIPLCPSCKRPFSKLGGVNVGCGTCGIKLHVAEIAKAKQKANL